MKTTLLQLVYWFNIALILMSACVEVYNFIHEKRNKSDLPLVFLFFAIYNLPFLLFWASLHYQGVPNTWLAVLRLLVLLLAGAGLAFFYYYRAFGSGGIAVGTGLFYFLLVAAILFSAVEAAVWISNRF